MLNVYVREPKHDAQASIIWMHGLGADASDMYGVANQLSLETMGVRHVFLEAPIQPVTINNGMHMPAWYDIYDFKSADREDKAGILRSETEIGNVVHREIEQGMPSSRIWLAGFSQGGAMALHTGLRLSIPLGGVIALSAYLPLTSECTPCLPRQTPIFFGYGVYDTIVLPSWSQFSINWLAERGYNQVVHHGYPMEHSICLEEIKHLSQWFLDLFKGEC